MDEKPAEKQQNAVELLRAWIHAYRINRHRHHRRASVCLNQAVKRNIERFPEDFAFQLSNSEFEHLKSQIVTSSWGGRRKPPWAFTEHGVAMLSSVLRSRTAARVNIEIMRAFVPLRRLMATSGELAQQLARVAETVELHDEQIKTIAEVLKRLMAEPPAPKEMGFHTLHVKRKRNSDQQAKI
jgi:hypothetical protein